MDLLMTHLDQLVLMEIKEVILVEEMGMEVEVSACMEEVLEGVEVMVCKVTVVEVMVCTGRVVEVLEMELVQENTEASTILAVLEEVFA